MHVPTVIQELLELTGDSQGRLAKRLGVSQSNISKWLNNAQQPSKPQWDRVMGLYFEMKGWRHSIDAKIAPYDDEFQEIVRRVVDDMVKIKGPPRRR